LNTQANRLREVGVRIVSLSVDKLGDDANSVQNPGDATLAAKWLSELNPDIDGGWATTELMERFQFLDDYLFTQKRPIVIPTSFLIDSNGCLAAIYRGPVDVSRIPADVKAISLTGRSLYESALPFPGRWYRPRQAVVPIQLAADLFKRGFVDDAAEYLQAHQKAMSQQAGFGSIAGQLAASMAKAKKTTSAIQLYRAALIGKPDDVALMNNLAWHLATHDDPGQRKPAEAVQWAEHAARLSKHEQMDVLDTLISAYEIANRLGDAIRIARQAVQLAEKQGQPNRVINFQTKIRQLESMKARNHGQSQ
jgi:tetratricopeptide (TPR) repeat protein